MPRLIDRDMSELGIPIAELDVLKAFNRSAVAYLLIGGYAMRWYGAGRPTIDVDLLASPALENARRLVLAIERVLGHAPGFSAKALAESEKQVRFAGDGYRLSILTSVPGLDFGAAYQERRHAHQGRIVIPVVSREHLVFIKRVAAASDPSRQNKELSDIAFLETHAPHNFGIQPTAYGRG
jgi:hypothetical protein